MHSRMRLVFFPLWDCIMYQVCCITLDYLPPFISKCAYYWPKKKGYFLNHSTRHKSTMQWWHYHRYNCFQMISDDFRANLVNYVTQSNRVQMRRILIRPLVYISAIWVQFNYWKTSPLSKISRTAKQININTNHTPTLLEKPKKYGDIPYGKDAFQK